MRSLSVPDQANIVTCKDKKTEINTLRAVSEKHLPDPLSHHERTPSKDSDKENVQDQSNLPYSSTSEETLVNESLSGMSLDDGETISLEKDAREESLQLQLDNVSFENFINSRLIAQDWHRYILKHLHFWSTYTFKCKCFTTYQCQSNAVNLGLIK